MPADLSDLVSPDLVLAGLAVASRKALFERIGQAAAPAVGLSARLLADALAAREAQGTTGFGGGVAIPHAKLDGVPAITAVVARLARPLGYGAVDDAPVDLVFAMFSPVRAGSDHLKALARVSHRLRDRGFLAKLRDVGSKDALYAVLAAGDEARDAA